MEKIVGKETYRYDSNRKRNSYYVIEPLNETLGHGQDFLKLSVYYMEGYCFPNHRATENSIRVNVRPQCGKEKDFINVFDILEYSEQEMGFFIEVMPISRYSEKKVEMAFNKVKEISQEIRDAYGERNYDKVKSLIYKAIQK